MSTHTAISSPSFLSGGGEMGKLIREFDWRQTPVGEIDGWPQNLRTTLGIVLNSGFPMFLWWGAGLTCFYNDAYRPSLGEHGKHPGILGQNAKDAWPEIWHFIKPLIDQVMSHGEPLWHEDMLLPIYRNGKLEDVYWTFSYSPVKNATGGVDGVLVVCHETTKNVLSRKMTESSEEKFRNTVSQAPVGIAVLRGTEFNVEMANSEYLQLVDKEDKEFVGKNLFDVLPEAREVVYPILARVLQTDMPFNAKELRVVLNQQGKKENAYFNLVYHPLKENGKTTGIMVVATEVTNQVAARSLLEQSEKKFRNVVMQSPVPMAVFTGRELVIQMANHAMMKNIWRKKEHDVLGKRLLDVFPELQAQKFPELLQQVITSRQPYIEREANTFIEGNDGIKEFYLDFEYAPLVDTGNKVSGVMVTVNDVTDKVTAREKIRDAEERIRLATEGTGMATWDLDLKTRAIIYSPRLAVIFGYPPFATITHPKMREHIHPDDLHTIVEKAFSAALKTGEYQYEARIIWNDRSVHWIRTRGKVLFNDKDEPYRMLGTMLDITKNKETEQQIARLAAIVDSSADAIISKKLDGTITSWNDSARRIFGYPAEEMIGQSIFKLFPPERMDEERGIIHLITSGHRVEHFESQRLTKSGKLIDVSLSISPLADSHGNITGVSKIARDITKQKISERLIAENEEWLKIVLEASELGTWELNLQTDELTYSEKYLQMLGYPEGSRPTYDELKTHLHPDDLATRDTAFKRSVETGILHYTTRVIWTDSSIHWIEARGKVFYDEQNLPFKIIGTARDITEEKNAKQRIEESESRLRIAALSSELGTWDYDPASGVLRWDDASRVLFGVDPETPITVDLFFSRMHPDDRDVALEKMKDAMNPDIASTYDVEYRTIGWPGNATRWIHAKGKAFFNNERQPIHFAGTVLDVTEKRKALDELKESEHKFRLLANSMPQHIWTGDADGNLNYFNKSVYDYSGFTPEELEKKGWIEIVHPDDRERNIEYWTSAIKTGQPFLFEHRFRRHDGEYRWQLSRAVPQKDEEGRIQMWVGTSTDVHDQKTFSDQLEKNVGLRTTELKQANEALTRTNRELEQFAYVSTHDLQEPLRKIQTFSGILSQKAGIDPDTARYLEKINASANRMSQLIKDLLVYSRLSKPDEYFVTVDLNEILDKVKNDFEVLIAEKGAIIHASKLPVIRAISVQMNQLFYNHIGNSLKFCDKAPVIDITCSRPTRAQIKHIPDLDPGREYICLCFKDNGIGFSKEYNELIFTIFQRLHGREKYSGTGIGLAMCKKIVENHHGFISASGEPGRGATFNIYLPVHSA